MRPSLPGFIWDVSYCVPLSVWSKRGYFFVVFPDFTLSNQDASTAALQPSAWTTTRPSQTVVTTRWTAFVANCRPFSGVVSGSPTLRSRSPNSPPAVTTARSVDSGTTWKLSWRRDRALETRGRGSGRARRSREWECRALLLPRSPTWVLPSLCPLRAPRPPIPLHQLTSPTLSWALWESGEVQTGAIWGRWRCGKGTAQRPQRSPKTPPVSPSLEGSSRCSTRARRRRGTRLWVTPSLQITALSTWTSARQSRETSPIVSCLTQLWLWRDCPWEMEVREQSLTWERIWKLIITWNHNIDLGFYHPHSSTMSHKNICIDACPIWRFFSRLDAVTVEFRKT